MIALSQLGHDKIDEDLASLWDGAGSRAGAASYEKYLLQTRVVSWLSRTFSTPQKTLKKSLVKKSPLATGVLLGVGLPQYYSTKRVLLWVG